MDIASVRQFALRVVEALDPDGLRMALITGSTARGLADDTSDIDIYLYCDRLHRSPPDPTRYGPINARPAFQVSTSSGWFTKLERDQRYIDVEAVDASVLTRGSRHLAAETRLRSGQ